MKKKEWLIIILIGVLAAAMILGRSLFSNSASYADPTGVVNAPQGKAKGEWVAVVHGGRIILYFDSGVDSEYTVEGDVGEMHIEVRDSRWHVSDVECYDYTCKRMGWADHDNLFPIICLPNDLVIVDAATAWNMMEKE
ncbi:MAG: NusG domain II-containing protein [Solobacterium sp.]|nr:NusG domain II-containing protein [Solobacterium sp.]